MWFREVERSLKSGGRLQSYLFIRKGVGQSVVITEDIDVMGKIFARLVSDRLNAGVGNKHEVCNVKVKDERLEQVKEMRYLGTVISSDGCMDSEVEQRVEMVSRMAGGNWKHSAGKKGIGKGDKIEGG